MSDRLDDTEYVRNVKAVIDGTDEFLNENKEIIDDSSILTQDLYQYSKELWLFNLKKSVEKEESEKKWGPADDEYYEYFYDFIYTHNMYPQ
jgi:hypothetical protein